MSRRTILIILSPFILILILLTLMFGLLQSVGGLTYDVAPLLLEIGYTAEVANEAQQIANFLYWFSLPFRLLFIPLLFIIALVLHRLNWRIAGWLLDSRITNTVRRPTAVLTSSAAQTRPEPSTSYRPQHRQTLQHLIASLISLTAFATAVFLTLLQFINSAGMAIIATVASTALGFGARDYINDLIMGVSDIFEDNFDVGDKVKVLRGAGDLQGIVEKVNVRTALLRSPYGIPITVPHGDIRVLRNFSRGLYSSTSVSFQVPATALNQTLAALEILTAESMALFPELIEPLQVISRTGIVAAQLELVVIGKALYGQGVDLRLRLFAEIEERLAQLPPHAAVHT